MSPELYPAFLLIGSVLGIYLAYLYGHKTKKFLWREYTALILAPTLGCLGMYFFYGPKIIYFFIACGAVGFVLEYSIGLAYHKTLNRRLWTYGRYSVGGYTSLLTFPMWGIAGVVFWIVATSIGL